MGLIDKEVLKAQLNNSICGYCDDCGDNCESCKISVVFETLEALPEYNAADLHPLPKGHGRLIDADKLKKYFQKSMADMSQLFKTQKYKDLAEIVTKGICKDLDEAPVVVEADKEVDE